MCITVTNTTFMVGDKAGILFSLFVAEFSQNRYKKHFARKNQLSPNKNTFMIHFVKSFCTNAGGNINFTYVI